jgi:hypothetical protein
MSRKKELDTILFFKPTVLKNIPITEEDEKKYFEWSEEGKHKHDIKDSHFTDGFNVLVSSRKWATRHMAMYEEGVLDGSMPYSIITEGMPYYVIDFMCKEMFKGKDSELIQKIYEANSPQTKIKIPTKKNRR